MKPVIIITIAFVFLFVPVNVFATHADDVDYSNDPDYEGKTPLRFYQIFVSEDKWYPNACEEAKNSMLHSKSVQILRTYDYLPITSHQECVKVTGDVEYNQDDDSSTFGLSLEETIAKAKNWHYDLLIIFFDNDLSKQYWLKTTNSAYPNGWWGHIKYSTNTIVSTTTVIDEDDENSIQTLAHEIAHYVVEKKYGYDIGGNAVHKVEDEFRDCHKWQTDWHLLETCPHLWTTVKTHYDYTIPVLSPDYVLQVAESMKPKSIPKPTPLPKDSDGDGYPDDTDSCPTQRENFNSYQDSDGCPDNPYSEPTCKNGQVLVNGICQIYKESVTISKSTSIALLGMSYHINGVQKSSGFEGDEVCFEYGLNLYPSGYPGASSPMDFESIRVTKEIVDYYGSVVGGPFTTWHTTDGSGKVNFCETLITPEGYWAITYRYSAQYPGGSVAYSNAPTLSMYFEQDPNNPYESEQEREQRELNARLVEEAEIGLKKQQELDELQRAFDKLEQEKIHEENILKLQIAKQEREQKEREELQEQKEREEHDEQLRNEVKILQSQAHNDLKLMHAVDKVEEELKKISSDTTEQKIIINKAWDLLKINKQKIADMEYAKKMGDKTLSSKEYKSSILNFEKVSKNGKQVDSNLNEISKSIKQIEKMQEQTCFLFWCW